MKNQLLATALVAVMILGCTGGNKNIIDKNVTVIKDVNLFDGENYREGVNIVFKDGVISEIDTGDVSAYNAALTINAAGKTIIPPLLNAHVHVWQENNLKEALRSGVFALFDMHTTDEAANYLRTFRDSAGYAYYYSSGPGATVPGGHGTQFGIKVPTIDESTSPKQFVEDRIKNHSDYIKILREPSMKTITFEQTLEVINTAHEHSKLCCAHISRLSDAMRLAGQNIDGFVHIWYDEQISDVQLDSLRKRNIFIVPTLIVIKKAHESGALKMWMKKSLAFSDVLKEAKKVYETGIPILAGTDAPNFSMNYGDDFYDELKLLSEAGIPNTDVLKAATSNVAKSFKLKEFGILAAGKPASFILINGNPIKNINDISKIESIWQNGRLIH